MMSSGELPFMCGCGSLSRLFGKELNGGRDGKALLGKTTSNKWDNLCIRVSAKRIGISP